MPFFNAQSIDGKSASLWRQACSVKRAANDMPWMITLWCNALSCVPRGRQCHIPVCVPGRVTQVTQSANERALCWPDMYLYRIDLGARQFLCCFDKKSAIVTGEILLQLVQCLCCYCIITGLNKAVRSFSGRVMAYTINGKTDGNQLTMNESKNGDNPGDIGLIWR